MTGSSVTGHSKIISDLGGPKTSMALASGGIIFFFSHSLMRAQSITDLISQILKGDFANRNFSFDKDLELLVQSKRRANAIFWIQL